MTKKIVTVSPETDVTAAAKLMFERHFNGLPVVDEAGCLLGIICQDDLIIQQKKVPLPSYFTLLDGIIPLASYKKIEKEVEKMVATTVAQAMTSNPITVDPETSLVGNSNGLGLDYFNKPGVKSYTFGLRLGF